MPGLQVVGARAWALAALAATVLLMCIALTRYVPLDSASVELAQRDRRNSGHALEGRAKSSKLADLVDSPLILAKEKIDNMLNFDTMDPEAETKAGFNEKKSKAKCTGLRCNDGVWENDFLSNGQKKMDEIIDGEDPRDEPYKGDWAGEGEKPISQGDLIKALSLRLKKMKEQFREAKAWLKSGPAKQMNIEITPRGPRGVPGPPGGVGPQGDQGPTGSFGPAGRKGRTGPVGRPGPQGRQGKKGPTGSIGKAGGVGGEGPRGSRGPRGKKGNPGARGLPGAAGVAGPNGKDGPPGPPGLSSGMGAPGPPGPIGAPGAKGEDGKTGQQGPRGVPGTTGSTGMTGAPGADGKAGADGVGPVKPKVLLTRGDWPEGKCYTKGTECTDLGITDNLCGQCKPLCEHCEKPAGFILENKQGLRFKGMSFDDQNEGKDTYQTRNICMLAKYGNKGTIKQVATAKSYGKSSESSSVPKEGHWYGRCSKGDDSKKECCSNSALLKSGFDWKKFATGDSCNSDDDTDRVLEKIVCVFDDDKYAKGLLPPKPSKSMKDGECIISTGKPWQNKLVNGEWMLSFGELTGAMRIRKVSESSSKKDEFGIQSLMEQLKVDDDVVWTASDKLDDYKAPFKCCLVNKFLKMEDSTGKALWTADGAGDKVTLTKGGALVLTNEGKCQWSSKGCPKEEKSEDSSNAIKVGGKTVKIDNSDPPANAHINPKDTTLLHSYCSQWEKEHFKQTEYKQQWLMAKCMTQDCEGSLDKRKKCRFVNDNGFCYLYKESQVWCATHPTNKWCVGKYDGGEEWAMAPVGKSKGDEYHTGWTPRQNIKLHKATSKDKTSYSCVCLKNCAASRNQRVRCAFPDEIRAGKGVVGMKPTPWDKIIADTSFMGIKKDLNKKKQCACFCGANAKDPNGVYAP